MRRTATRALLVSLTLALLGAASRPEHGGARTGSPPSEAARPSAAFAIHERSIVKTIDDRVWVAHFGDAAGAVPTITMPGQGEWIPVSESRAVLATLGIPGYERPSVIEGFDDDSRRLTVALDKGATFVLLDAEPDAPDVDPSFDYWIDAAP